MKKNLTYSVFWILPILATAGCNNGDAAPAIDQNAMKAQPGATVPAAAATKPTADQVKKMKTGD